MLSDLNLLSHISISSIAAAFIPALHRLFACLRPVALSIFGVNSRARMTGGDKVSVASVGYAVG